MDSPKRQVLEGRLVLPSPDLLALIADGQVPDAVRQYRLVTGLSAAEAESVLRDPEVLERAREHAERVTTETREWATAREPWITVVRALCLALGGSAALGVLALAWLVSGGDIGLTDELALAVFSATALFFAAALLFVWLDASLRWTTTLASFSIAFAIVSLVGSFLIAISTGIRSGNGLQCYAGGNGAICSTRSIGFAALSYIAAILVGTVAIYLARVEARGRRRGSR